MKACFVQSVAQPAVLVTRPVREGEALRARLEPMGWRVLMAPLLEIGPLSFEPTSLSQAQALALTSVRAVAAIENPLSLPVYAVGEATAEAARAAGWEQVTAADGDAASLAKVIIDRCDPDKGPIVHLAGADTRPGLALALGEAGFGYHRLVVYSARLAKGLPAHVVQSWQGGDISALLLFSPRSASHLVQLIRRHALEGCVGSVEAICLSEAVASPCRALDWKAVRVAAHPSQDALIQILKNGPRSW